MTDSILSTDRERELVVHIGPAALQIGGMETVLRTYRDLPWAKFRVELVSSCVRGSTMSQVLLLSKGIAELARLRRSNGPTLVHVHVSQRGAFVREGLLVCIAASMGHRVFITIHGSQFVRTSSDPKWRALYRFVLNRAKGVAVLNQYALHAARAIGVGTPLVVLPNPGPVGPRKAVRDAGQSFPTAVFAGAVGGRKGVDVLLDAWAQVSAAMPDARLEIIGPVVDAEIGDRAAEFLLGPKDSEEVLDALSSARVAVLPSRAEGMPMFLLEALGMGRPIVVSDVGAMPALASNTGIVAPVGDSRALAEALLVFLESPSRATAAGAAGLALYEAEYGVAVVEKALRDFYDVS